MKISYSGGEMLNFGKVENVLKEAGIKYNLNNVGENIGVEFTNKIGTKISMLFDNAIDGINQIIQTKAVSTDGKAISRVFSINPSNPKLMEVSSDIFVGGKLKKFSTTTFSFNNDAVLGGKPVELNRNTTHFIKNGAVQSKHYIDFRNCGRNLTI